MSSGSQAAAELGAAMPLAACQAYGLGPFAGRRSNGAGGGGTALRPSRESVVTAADSSGVIGGQLLSVLAFGRGTITAEALAFETAGADPDDLAAAVGRLVAAGLVVRGRKGGLRLGDVLLGVLAPIGVSLADQDAITSDVLQTICRQVLGSGATPNRKQERIDALAAHFGDPARHGQTLAMLSPEARALLEAIAEQAGPAEVPAEVIGIPGYALRMAAPARYGGPRRTTEGPLAGLAELAACGIVGMEPYEGRLWIWREAWPLIDRPLFPDWPSVPPPATAPVADPGLRIPPVVALVTRALHHWDASPPPVLKGGEVRLGKPAVRATAKALATDEGTLELVAGMALSLGLLLPNVVAVTGRGRNRRESSVWLADEDLRSAWAAAPPPARWLRMFAEWANPAPGPSRQLVANRHLVLWELACLEPGSGWVDDRHAARWIEHHHAPIAVAEAVTETLADLRRLGVVPPTGPVGLTELGRLALTDPAAVAEASFGAADSAIVQADHTVVCPPDLASDLLVQLQHLARLESDRGALLFRLDGDLLTAAVQKGTTAEEILAFLDTLSSVPVADTVRRLVGDAAARADRVRVVSAATVVVFTEPADLVTACKIAGAKLTALTPTVAVSALPAAKVVAALARKGLAPLAVSSDTKPAARRSADVAAEYEEAAERHRRLGQRFQHHGYAREAERLEAAAAAVRDPASRLAVRGPIAVTPALLGVGT